MTDGVSADPTPVSGRTCGLPGALSAIATVPVRVPLAVGVKLTVRVHVAPAAIVPAHVLVCPKSPLAVTLAIVVDDAPMLRTVTTWLVLAPTASDENSMNAGDSERPSGTVPVPSSGMT